MEAAAVTGLHLRIGDIQVGLNGFDASMANEFLDRGNRHPGFDQMPSEGMAKLVAGDPNTLWDLRIDNIARQYNLVRPYRNLKLDYANMIIDEWWHFERP